MTITPQPTTEEVAAIMAAFSVVLDTPQADGPVDATPRWRFSGRHWMSGGFGNRPAYGRS